MQVQHGGYGSLFEPPEPANLAECRVSLQCDAAAPEPTPTSIRALFSLTLALERLLRREGIAKWPRRRKTSLSDFFTIGY